MLIFCKKRTILFNWMITFFVCFDTFIVEDRKINSFSFNPCKHMKMTVSLHMQTVNTICYSSQYPCNLSLITYLIAYFSIFTQHIYSSFIKKKFGYITDSLTLHKATEFLKYTKLSWVSPLPWYPKLRYSKYSLSSMYIG